MHKVLEAFGREPLEQVVQLHQKAVDDKIAAIKHVGQLQQKFIQDALTSAQKKTDINANQHRIQMERFALVRDLQTASTNLQEGVFTLDVAPSELNHS